MTEVYIRSASLCDYCEIADAMFDAVRNGPSQYTDEQRKAWLPQPRTGQDWNNRLNAQKIQVAIKDSSVIGFMTLARNGYIDLAFVRPSDQGTGVFRLLYESIENLAKLAGETRVWVHASLMAQPAFSAMGFATTQMETVEIGNQSLERFVMEKRIS